jgi:hypothetical protein
MDNGSKFPYRFRLVQGDGEGQSQLGNGSPSASQQGEEERRKLSELSGETGELRLVSGIDHASQKSPKHHKSERPVPETDTGRGVENTKGREITLSKELGKMTP